MEGKDDNKEFDANKEDEDKYNIFVPQGDRK